MTERRPAVARLPRPQARLNVTLAGELTVTYGGCRLGSDAFRGRQARHAFAYLALHSRPVPRDELAEAIWPGALPPAWEGDLSAVVSRVRSALARLPTGAGASVASRSGGYQLELGDDGAVDVGIAVEALAEAGAAGAAGDLEGARSAAATAATLLRPPLLADLDAPWLDRWRDERRTGLAEALELLAGFALAAGEPGVAAGHAREGISVDPYRETVHALLMRAHLAAGNRAAALRAYDDVRLLLVDDLGVDPGADVEALREDARRPPPITPAAPARLSIPAIPAIPARDECATFVGRDAELRSLQAAVAPHGPGARLVLVEGEPGIGKTCLVGELARAVDGSALVMAGRCDEYSTVPYLAIIEALGHWARSIPDPELAGAVGPDPEPIARLVPELAERLGATLAAAMTSDPAADRHRLFAAVAGVLSRLGDQMQVVLAIDDLQWADAGTVQLLRHVVLAGPSALSAVATYRTADPAPAGGLLTDVLAELRSRDRVVRVGLSGLDHDAIGELLATGGAAAASPRWAGALRDATGGNPLFVREIVRHLAGASLPDPTADRSASELMALAGIPATIGEMLARRLGRLPTTTRDALNAAAVAGVEFDLALVASVSALDDDTALTAMEDAVDAGLVSEIADRPDGYRFTHPLVAEVLARALSGARRSRLHHSAGVALAARGDAAPAGDVARHLVAAGHLADPLTTSTQAERAGTAALAQFAYEEAADRYSDALEALSRVPPGAGEVGERRLELLLALADARTRAGDGSAARGPVVEALDLARRIGAGEVFGRAAMLNGSLLLDEGVEGGMVNESLIAVLDEALAANPRSATSLRARLLARRSIELQFGPRMTERGQNAREAEHEARASADPEALLAALTARHYDLLGSPQVGDRLSVSFAIDELGHGLASPAVPNPRIARDYLELGDVVAMRNALATFEARAKAIGVASWLWLPALWAATTALMEGRLDEGEALSVRARDIGRQVRGPDAADAVHAAQLFALYQLQDRLGELAPVLEVFPDTQPHRPVWRAAAACAWAEGGDYAKAEAMLAPLAEAGWDALPVNVDLPVTLTLAAWVAGALDAQTWASGVYERLLPYRDLCVVVGVWPAVCSGSAAYPLAVAAATAGLSQEADAAFAHAHAVNERIGATPWVARVEAARARAGI